MPITLDLPHRCPPEKAKTCIEQWLQALRSEQSQWIEDASAQWDALTANFTLCIRKGLRFKVTGTLRVDAGGFHLEASLPLMARPWREKIEMLIRDSLRAKCAACDCKTLQPDLC
jgi:hypothetical protein